jgi:hypothetical protein
VQLVALVALHDNVLLPLGGTEAGLAASVNVGAGFGTTVTVALIEAVPPAPVHANE